MLDNVILRPVDLKLLLSQLKLSEETLRSAAVSQPKLFEKASRFYVQAMKSRMEAEARYEERKANRGHYFRTKKLRINERKGRKDVTERRINELVTLSPSVIKFRAIYEEAMQLETYAKRLLEAFWMRRDMIRALSGVMEGEIRQDYRDLRARRSKEEFDDLADNLNKKYSGK